MISTYYEGAGADDRWRIVFPPRGYHLQIKEVTQIEEPPALGDELPAEEPVPSLVEPSAAGKPGLISGVLRPSIVAPLTLILFAVFCFSVYRATRESPAAMVSLRPHTPTLKARAEYLKGRYYWEHRTGASLQQAADAYTQAIVADSDYALAYAGLAETYDLMPEYSAASQSFAFSRAIDAANKSIRLDPAIAIAHRALAFGLFWSQTDIPSALAEFKRAIQLAPNDPEAHHWYATALSALQRYPEARREIDLAQQLAPASRSILVDQAWIRYCAGDSQAKAALEDLEMSEPDFRSPPAFLARIDLAEGDYPGYLKQLHTLAMLSGDAADKRLAAAGQRGWAAAGATGMLRDLQSVQKQSLLNGRSNGFDLAHTCGLLGEKEDAMRYLLAALAAKEMAMLDVLRPDWAPELNGYPPFESLRMQVRQHFGLGNP
jgi:tetratricopeptide (TPR) repeat protein